MQQPSLMQLRKLRERVRTFVNLVGSGERIREQIGTWWRANMKTRSVEWVPNWPFYPYDAIDDEGLLYCIAHEASHLKWSGRYTPSARIAPEHHARFHRFVNAIEDIRVDRLSSRQFGSFRQAKLHTDRLLRQAQLQTNPAGWSLVDTVAMNAIYSCDVGEPVVGSPAGIEAVKRLWPVLDRLGNARSTADVAAGLEPIFLELLALDQELKRRKEEEEKRQQEERRQEAERRQEEQRQAEAQAGSGEPSDGEPEESAEQDAEQAGETEPEPGDGEAEDEAEQAGEPEEKQGGEQAAEDAQEAEEPTHSGSQGEQEEGEEEVEGEGEAEDDEQEPHEPEPSDPFDALGSLDDGGFGGDEPTDVPSKSEGDPDTDPLGFGDELKGMSQDSTDINTRVKLQHRASEVEERKKQMRVLSQQLEGRTAQASYAGAARWDATRSQKRAQVNTLGNRLKAVLRQNAMDNPVGGQRRGRLDTGKLYRADAGNVRIFRRPGQMGGLDYTFGFTIDTSGSMFSRTHYRDGVQVTEAEATFEALVIMVEALAKAGLGVFVILWDVGIQHTMPLGAPLGDHRARLGDIFTGFGGGSTVESPALARAIEEFKKVRSGKRMLIGITDGQTSTVQESTELLAEIEQMGIDAVPIRIGGSTPHYWPHGYSIDHADELVRLLPKIINSVVRRGA